MSDRRVPTDEGLRRYPMTKGYHPEIRDNGDVPDFDYPCTCTAVCHPRCGGECGCLACGLAFSLYCEDLPLIKDGEFDRDSGLMAFRYGAY